jgi:hypothetical protein
MANTYTRVCVVDACENKHDSHGFCGAHIGKYRRHGSAFGPFKRRLANMCYADECDKRGPIYGLCSKHSNWKKRTGNPNVRPPKATYVPRSIKGQRATYKYLSIKNHPILKDGLYTEHRVVMTEIMGRLLLSNENVHHINGDGKDNRPENLELWIISQPPGQRLEDKVEWAMELLRKYKPDVLKEGV